VVSGRWVGLAKKPWNSVLTVLDFKHTPECG
jgi:hypothetical protein